MFRNKKTAVSALSTTTRFFNPLNAANIYHRQLLTPNDPILTSSEIKACTEIYNGEALAKILPITPPVESASGSDERTFTLWKDHIKQLKDHSKSEIVQSKKSDSKEEMSEAPNQVISTTLISKKLHTILFTSFESGPAPAGLLYSSKKCVIKALLTDKDRAYTFDHGQVPIRDQLAHPYQGRIASATFTDINSFQHYIDDKDLLMTNEVFAEVNRDSLLAIIVDSTNMENGLRSLIASEARKRRADISHEFGVTLPIIYYHALRNEIAVYSVHEQDLDQLKLVLQYKLDFCSRNAHSIGLSFFSPEDVSYSFEVKSFIQGKVNRKTAEEIVDLINTYKKQGMSALNAKEMIQMKCGQSELLFPLVTI